MRPTLAAVALLTLSTGVGCNPFSKASSGDEGGAAAAAASPALPGLGAFLTGFEGEIDAVVKETKPGAAPQDLALAVFVKNGKLRIDLPEKLAQGPAAMLGPKAYGIFDSAAKKVYLVADARKEVIVIDLEKSGEQLKGVGKPPEMPHAERPAAPERPPSKITKTGKFDTVAGYKCENWDIASDHREGTVCVAQEGASWFSIPMTGIPTEHAWALELLDGKHFPMRFVGYAKDGTTEDAHMEITKIDKKTLPPTEFEYPPAYKVVDLAQMFGGMMGRMPGGMPGGGMPGGMPGMPGMAGMPGGGMPPMPHPHPHP
jgi:hypothetical protein